MTTSAGSRPGVGSLLWFVAFSALALASIAVPASPPGVLSLLALGHLLTAIAVAADLLGERSRRPEDATFLIGLLAAFAAVESLGLYAAWAEGERAQECWFLAALGFALAGAVASWRGGATDGAVGVQVFFHAVMSIPAIAAVATLAVRGLGTAAASSTFSASGPIARLLFVVTAITLAPLFAALIAAIAYGSAAARGRRSPVWPSLLVHEAAFVALAARWAYDGL